MSHHNHDDHSGHSHQHHDHHDHGHHHDHSDETEPALQSLIYQPIEFDGIRTLNETEPNSGTKVVQKTWAQRLDNQPFLSSDADEQLLMYIPFAGAVKLHSLLIRSSNDDSAAQTLKLFTNKDDLDFDAASEQRPTQTLGLSRTSDVQEVPVQRSLFNNVYSLSVYFEDNYGECVTHVYYLGFKGEFMRLNREPVEFLYEKAANPRDHTLVQGVANLGAQDSGDGM